MSFVASLLGLLPVALKAVLQILNILSAEKLKQAGINEQVLENLKKQQAIQKAADDARKNPPNGNIIDHL